MNRPPSNNHLRIGLIVLGSIFLALVVAVGVVIGVAESPNDGENKGTGFLLAIIALICVPVGTALIAAGALLGRHEKATRTPGRQ